MASPFRTFRKNKKAWMVPIAILAMISFVFLGATTRFGGPTKAEDPVVFTWNYGSVRKSDLRDRRFILQAVNQFLAAAATTAGLPPQTVARMGFPVSDKEIVDTMLLEKKAEQMGIVVSDDVVNRFINAMTDDKLRPQQLAQISNSVSARYQNIGQAQIFDAIRSQLAARFAFGAFSPLLNRTGGMVGVRFGGDTPGDRWDYFCRLNRQATAQILPVPVEKFVSEIPDPATDVLVKFYDQYKNTYFIPNSPTPGFRQPPKAKFQYIKADYEQLVAAQKPKVTEQEIKEYYEKHKDEFKKSRLPDLPKSDATNGKPESEAPPAQSAADTKPADSKSAAGKSTGTKPNGTKSGDTKAPDPKSTEPKSTDSKSALPKATDAKKSDTQKKSPDGKQSSNSPSNSLNGELLAFADPAATPAQKSAVAPKSEPKASTSKAPDTKAETAKPAGSTAASSDIKAPDTKTPDAQASTPVEYEPLDKVTDTIRNLLAQQKADADIDAAFSAIELNVDQYTRSLEAYRAAVNRGNKSAKKPTPPDLAALAKPYGLEAKETDLISAQQAYSQTDLGKSSTFSVVDPSIAAITGQRYKQQAFVQTAYAVDSNAQPILSLFLPQRTTDNDNNRYLWWKTADEAAHTPAFDEIKPEVTMAWKLIQARQPAKAKADANAEQARKLKQTLKETFANIPGTEVSTVGPFSWLTVPTGQPFGQPRLTQVSGVEQGGQDFMKAVFALKPGQTGVAVNDTSTIYYVVQVESEQPPLEQLQQEFMTKMANDMSSIPYAQIAADDNRAMGYAWFKQLQDEFSYQLAPGETLSETRGNID